MRWPWQRPPANRVRISAQVAADYEAFMRARQLVEVEGATRLRMMALAAGVDPATVTGVDTDRAELILAE